MARKFLILIAAIITLILAAGILWSLFATRIMETAFVPGGGFVKQPPVVANAYADKAMWIARPDLPGNPALWMPAGFTGGPRGSAAVFFIHPTSYLDRSRWNAPLDDKAANDRAVLFVRGQASAFNGVGEVWAPRYRQAAFGAFLTTRADAQAALDLAYGDVRVAFDHFIATVAPDRPIILAGHSQGSLHLLRLLRERIAGKPIAARIVAVYAVGWPISVSTDLPALGLPGCAQAAQAGCILSWQSFAEPADPAQIVAAYAATPGFDGRSRRGTKMLCTNPLTGTQDARAAASTNLGTIVPSADLSTGTLAVAMVPARCNDQGFLLIGPPPEGIGNYVLPGNNYHVFDYSLFWANIRSDAARRLATFTAR